MSHSELTSTCALRPCTLGAAARHIESKTSGTTLNVVARAHSELASSCAMRPSTIGAAARQIEFGPDSARHDHGPLRVGPSHCFGRPTRLESPWLALAERTRLAPTAPPLASREGLGGPRPGRGAGLASAAAAPLPGIRDGGNVVSARLGKTRHNALTIFPPSLRSPGSVPAARRATPADAGHESGARGHPN